MCGEEECTGVDGQRTRLDGEPLLLFQARCTRCRGGPNCERVTLTIPKACICTIYCGSDALNGVRQPLIRLRSERIAVHAAKA